MCGVVFLDRVSKCSATLGLRLHSGSCTAGFREYNSSASRRKWASPITVRTDPQISPRVFRASVGVGLGLG